MLSNAIKNSQASKSLHEDQVTRSLEAFTKHIQIQAPSKWTTTNRHEIKILFSSTITSFTRYMAPIQNYDYNFPYFPQPPPHYSPSPPKVPPPPPQFPPPPHHPSTPPPPPAKPPSHSTPPPPPTLPPPPHHIRPPPPPHVLPPPPPPGHHSTIIVVIFVSLGGLFFLAFLAIALCYLIKKRKKRAIQETDVVRIDEHVRVQEAIIQGPHGAQAVILSIEEDVHVEEDIKRNKMVRKGISHVIGPTKDHPQALVMAASTSESGDHHHLDHKS